MHLLSAFILSVKMLPLNAIKPARDLLLHLLKTLLKTNCCTILSKSLPSDDRPHEA